jgi:PilZ domain-containing protein
MAFGRASRPADRAPPKPARPDDAPNHRKARRKRTLLSGKLAYGAGAFSIDCVISDLSETGARVQVQPGATIPEQIYLIHLRARTAYQAKVAWRRGDFAGLEFLATHDLEKADTAELKLMRLYCVDRAPRWAGISSDEL